MRSRFVRCFQVAAFVLLLQAIPPGAQAGYNLQNLVGSSGVPGGCSRVLIVSPLIAITCDGRSESPALRLKSLLRNGFHRNTPVPTARNTGRAKTFL